MAAMIVGAVLAGAGRTLYEKKVKFGECTKLRIEHSKLQSRLSELETELEITEPVRDKLKRQNKVN